MISSIELDNLDINSLVLPELAVRHRRVWHRAVTYTPPHQCRYNRDPPRSRLGTRQERRQEEFRTRTLFTTEHVLFGILGLECNTSFALVVWHMTLRTADQTTDSSNVNIKIQCLT